MESLARRLSTFVLPSGFLRQWLPSARNAPAILPIARFDDGRLAVTSGGMRALDGVVGKLTRDSLRIGIAVPVDTAAVRWLGEFPGATWLGFRSPFDHKRAAVTRALHSPQLTYATSENVLWLGDGSSATLTRFDSFGHSLPPTRVMASPRSFDFGALQRGRVRQMAQSSDDYARASVEAVFDRTVLPALTPVYSRIIGAPAGAVWVELYRESLEQPRRYEVIDASGRSVATVVGPPNFVLFDIGVDVVVGALIDDDGVEMVASFGIVRDAAVRPR